MRAGSNNLGDKMLQADDSDHESITRRTTGGLNGLKYRQALYKRALEALGTLRTGCLLQWSPDAIARRFTSI